MDKAIINRFIHGKASPEEVRKVLKWCYSDEAEYQMAEKIELLWHNEDNSQSSTSFNKSEILAKIKAKANIQHQELQILSESRNDKKVKFTFFMKIAAAIILVFTLSWAIYNYVSNPLQQQDNLQVEIITKSTTKGQKFTTFLEDGTKVKLNAESSLQYPATFSDNNRVVYLSGEAFFDVKKDAQRPFKVISGDISTTAVGTSFNINAYPADKKIVVSLATGKVKVTKNPERTNIDQEMDVILEPGTQAVYSVNDQHFNKQSFNIRNELAWKDGILNFQDASWTVINNKLERWYGIEISLVNKPVSDKLYTGSFNDESLDNVLESLSFSKNFSYRVDSQKVYVTFK